jgi:glycerol-3-phosphate dehydrogenase
VTLVFPKFTQEVEMVSTGQKQLESEVVIIGGGMTGAAIARELSRYKVDTVLLEQGGELCAGQTKATQGVIYTGLIMLMSMLIKTAIAPGVPPYDPNSMKMKWCEEGFSKDWPRWFKELDINHRDVPALVIAKQDEEQLKNLKTMQELGASIGGVYNDFRQLDREEILAIEPNITPEVITGLYAEGHCVDIFPPEATIALAENAVQNGVRIMLDTEVTGVDRDGGYQIVQTTKGPIKTNFIVNAAGKYVDKVADMGGPRDWGLQFNKTQIMMLDRRVKGLIKSNINFPAKPGVVYIISPRDENIMVECGIYDITNGPEDIANYREGYKMGMSMGRELVPSLSEADIIRSYVGVRLFHTRKRDIEDHIVEFSSTNPRFLNVVIRLPGFISAPPMARHVVSMLADAGLKLVSKPDFNPYRKAIPRFRDLSNEERSKLIAQDPRYGHVVCRCETVTEGEIVEAIKRGARTEEGVKMRTRAGMGRCQGGFCSPRVIDILARELNIPVTQVTKRSSDSPFLLYKSKELLGQAATRRVA